MSTPTFELSYLHYTMKGILSIQPRLFLQDIVQDMHCIRFMRRDYQVTKGALLTVPLKLKMGFYMYFVGDNIISDQNRFVAESLY